MLSFLSSDKSASVSTDVALVEEVKQPQSRRTRRKKPNPRAGNTDRCWNALAQAPPKPTLGWNDGKQVYTVCKSTAAYPFLTANNAVNVFAGRTFALSDIADYAAYIAAFDEYRIVEIEAWLTPRMSDEKNGYFGNYISAVDYTDTTSPGTFNDLLTYQNALYSPMSDGHYRKLVPSVADEIYETAVTSGYGVPGPQWLATADPSIPHFGLKVFCQPCVTGTNYYLDLYLRYKIQFRCVN